MLPLACTTCTSQYPANLTTAAFNLPFGKKPFSSGMAQGTRVFMFSFRDSTTDQFLELLAVQGKIAEVLTNDELRHWIDVALKCDRPVQVCAGPMLVTALRTDALAALLLQEFSVTAQRYVPQAGRHVQAAGNKTSSSKRWNSFSRKISPR